MGIGTIARAELYSNLFKSLLSIVKLSVPNSSLNSSTLLVEAIHWSMPSLELCSKCPDRGTAWLGYEKQSERDCGWALGSWRRSKPLAAGPTREEAARMFYIMISRK